MQHVCFALNHTYNATIDNVPLIAATGSTCDISPLLRFSFWQPVYFMRDDSNFPSDSSEDRGRFVGIAESFGHYMTFKTLKDDTRKIICRSNVRSADDGFAPNLRIDPLIAPIVVKSKDENDTKSNDVITDSSDQKPIAIINPSELVGRSFLLPADENGQILRAKIVKAIENHEDEYARDPTKLKFVCYMKEDQIEETCSYNEILDYLEQQEDQTVLWKFKRIVAHEGPLSPNHPIYNGSMYNVKVEWENGEITYEPLSIVGTDDPVTCALHAKENDLLDEPG